MSQHCKHDYVARSSVIINVWLWAIFPNRMFEVSFNGYSILCLTVRSCSTHGQPTQAPYKNSDKRWERFSRSNRRDSCQCPLHLCPNIFCSPKTGRYTPEYWTFNCSVNVNNIFSCKRPRMAITAESTCRLVWKYTIFFSKIFLV